MNNTDPKLNPPLAEGEHTTDTDDELSNGKGEDDDE